MHRLLRLLPAVFALLAADASAVVVSEVMYHPQSEASAEEFIELHNPGATAVDVSGWAITSGVSFTIPALTPAIPAGGYLVLAANGAAFTAKYPAVTNFVAGWTGQLSNSANSVVLKDNLGVKMDEVDYADDGDWAVRERDDLDLGHRGWRWRSLADGFGKSLELINKTFDNSYGQNWGASTAVEGTPGAANSIAAANIAPVVSDVQHYPLVPTSSQEVTVNATVLDDLGAAVTVTVSYRNDGGSWTTSPMFDDGAHDDGIAGDKIFGAQLPAQADDMIVEFYVSVTDGTNPRTWPAPALNNPTQVDPYVAEQSQNCLYQVDNTGYAGAMPLYRVVMKAADRATLTSINLGTGGNSHARYNSTFITVDGTGTELRYQCATRNRGHGSATRQPQSLRIGIPNDWDWRGRTALNFNSQYTYLQLLGSAYMRKAGLAAPETRQIQLRVNGADPASSGSPSYGFYACVEVLDSDFAEHHFPLDDGGNIYSIRRTDSGPYQEGDLTYLTPAGVNGGDPYRPVYFKETNGSEDDWTDLISLTQALDKGHFTTLAAAPTWDGDYVSSVQAKVNVGQWMRWFAAEALLGNNETNIARGYGDDYYLYLGVTDPRANLLPWDLDTILGHGDSAAVTTEDLFRMVRHTSGNYAANTPTPLLPFMRHPEFAPLYFREIDTLLSGTFSVANFNALVDQTLTGVVSASLINARKAWFATRHGVVNAMIPRAISVTSAPAVVSGYPQVLVPGVNLTGRANVLTTASVKVNGTAASYVPWRVASTGPFTPSIGEWSLTGIALTPGINRLLIQSFDSTGAETERLRYDVWYDDTTVAPVTGALPAGTTTWTAAGGPYQLTGNVSVPATGTLVIEPGTTVYSNSAVTLTVAAGGRILAEGTEAQPIHFTRLPGTATNSGTITINGAAGAPETHFYHTFFNFGGNPAVDANANSNIVLDYCEWLRTDVAYLHLDGGSFIVSNCIFPTANATSYFEGVHGNVATPAGGRAIVRDCFFGKCHSIGGDYNDVFDFTAGNRPGAILQLINNVFVGSDDDLIDIDGTDAWVEGNIFMHVHRVGSPDSASAVSGGSGGGQTSELTVVGNLFYDVDQAMTAKQGNFYTFLNNTVVDQNSRGSEELLEDIINEPNVFLPAVLNFADHGVAGALGMYAEGNVIHSAEKLLRNYTGAELVTFNNNLFPTGMTWAGPGSGNTSAAALLNDIAVSPTGASNIPTPTKDNYRWVGPQIRQQFGLDDCSPARGTGPNGTDKGGIRPLGVSLSGAPTGTTNATVATVTVGTLMTGSGIPSAAARFPNGSGWTHYKHRLDLGAWSAETPIATPISLSGLANGTHTLDVVGKNDANYYQDSADLGSNARISSATWTVDSGSPTPTPAAIVRINEVLASNTETVNFGTVFPDIIELTNTGNATADLGGWGLTDNAALPFKYTIPGGTMLAPGAHLVIYASGNAAVPAPKTGFGLGASGDDLTLTRSAAAGGGIADSVVWGQQLADYSIGRCADGSWELSRPTFGAANVLAAQSPASGVRINEWLADAVTLFANDFIELHNPGQLPVDIGGHFLTDNPAGWPGRSVIRQLTFIHAGGFLSFKADADTTQGPDHVNFRLSPLQGEIGFVSPELAVLDLVIYGPQRTDISQGRSPDGAASVATFTQPSPGAPNPYDTTATTVTQNTVLTPNVITAPQTWSYYQHASAAPALDGSGRAFTHPLFDDTAWLSAAGSFHIEPSAFPANPDGFAKTTLLTGHDANSPYQTYYFRTHFTYNGTLAGGAVTVELRGRVICDDGAVFYLNGQPLTPRLRVATGAANYGTQATGTSPEVTLENMVLTSAGLVNGDNVLAVSVHQSGSQSATTGSSDITWGMKLDIAAITTTTTITLGIPVVLNEVLPVNVTYQNPDGSYAGWIELLNTSATAYDLSDFSLTDAVGTPRKFVFGAGTIVPADGRLVIYCNPLAAIGATNTAFSLNPAGDQIYLFKSLALGGGLTDSLVFGQQVPDFSLARTPDGSGPFALGVPTRGALNAAAGTASASGVKLNEWVTNPAGAAPSWFEMFNTAAQPVLLSGNYLTDALTNKTKHLVPPLTFLGGAGASRWLQLIADNDASATPNHVNFTLNPGEGLGFYTAAGTALGTVTTTAQAIGSSQGRYGDGTSAIITMPPTPGAANQQPNPDTDGDGIPDAWETANGLNPADPLDAALDTDGDGQSNLAEYLAGTDPQSAASRLAASIVTTATPGEYAVRFTAVAGKTYTVRYKNALSDATWTTLANVPAQGADTLIDVPDPAAGAQPKRFYQVVTPQQP